MTSNSSAVVGFYCSSVKLKISSRLTLTMVRLIHHLNAQLHTYQPHFSSGGSPTHSITICRRFQFSSALKRMANVSTLGVGGKSLFSVKGAQEVIKRMLAVVPEGYDDTFKSFTPCGRSRVLALAMREVPPIGLDKVRSRYFFHSACADEVSGCRLRI